MTNQSYNTTPEVDWILVGGVTSSSATFRVRSTGVTLIVSESESLTNPIPEETLGINSNSPVQSVNVTTLQPQTTYYYASVQSDNPAVIVRQGSFRTPGISRANHSTSRSPWPRCAWTGSQNDIFRQIAAHDPLFMLHLGDFHYEDISANDLQMRINAVDLVLGSDSQLRASW
jgi:phosphodiesterase/alkaline phosphatase D-like protein